MLDSQLWDLLPDGMPRAVFPRSLQAMSAGGQGVLLVEYAETPEAVQTGPYKTIQIYMNPALAEHFRAAIDATLKPATQPPA